ncbi:hypothetical protein JKP88DRAFT_271111 [Tribonema minus]|uniref:Uncharacterized protein n=1 Tax=Tribonema minus TaxID=303371 RepID=A0A835ZF95_9STRA|nr:hypothetical protein JKP88DRAFT_271111 [Tribonema minus]
MVAREASARLASSRPAPAARRRALSRLSMAGEEPSKLTDEQMQKMRLREEVENPFRKVRLFFLYSFVASGTVGFLIAALRTIALTQGIDQGQAFPELAQNIGIDLAAIIGSALLIKRDLAAQNSRLVRMEIGAKLAGLKVRTQVESEEATIPLSAFRRQRGRDKRVAIVVGGADAVAASLSTAIPYSDELDRADIVLVPLSQLEEAVGQKHVALPVMLNSWQEWVDTEVATATGQGFDVLRDGFAVILKKNGRVGTRSKGCPPWNVLVGDVQARVAANMDTTNI